MRDAWINLGLEVLMLADLLYESPRRALHPEAGGLGSLVVRIHYKGRRELNDGAAIHFATGYRTKDAGSDFATEERPRGNEFAIGRFVGRGTQLEQEM